MMAKARIWVCLLFAMELLSVATLDVSAQGGFYSGVVNGTVSYLQRIALPAGAVVNVQLQDVSLADVAAMVMGEQTITTTGNQVPFPFEIKYDPAAIQERNTYAVRATIKVNGQLMFTTTQQYRVITQGNPSTVDLVLEQVDSSTPPPGGDTDSPPSTLPNTGAMSGLGILLALGVALLLGGRQVRRGCWRQTRLSWIFWKR
jgi:uncharacterized lipoprotein YbaY